MSQTYDLKQNSGNVFFGRSGVAVAKTAGFAALVVAGLFAKRMVLPLRVLMIVASTVGIVFSMFNANGEPVGALMMSYIRHAVRSVTGRRTFIADLEPNPFSLTTTGPLFAGLTVKAGQGGVAFVCDEGANTQSILIRVAGTGFGLASANEKAGRVNNWGNLLAELTRDSSGITRISWTEHFAPVGLEAHGQWLGSVISKAPDAAAFASYDELLQRIRAEAVRAEVIVSISMAASGTSRLKHRLGASIGGSNMGRASQNVEHDLLEQAKNLIANCTNSGYSCSPPLTVEQLAHAVRSRLVPKQAPYLHGSASDGTGTTDPKEMGPVSIEQYLSSIVIDGQGYHAILRVSELPRRDVNADWLSELLYLRDSAQRTYACIYTPISTLVASRIARHAINNLAADAEGQAQKGKLLTARSVRTAQAAQAVEFELDQGHALLDWTMLVDVSANSKEELDRAVTATVEKAKILDCTVRPLSGRQLAGLRTCLPLGLGVERTR